MISRTLLKSASTFILTASLPQMLRRTRFRQSDVRFTPANAVIFHFSYSSGLANLERRKEPIDKFEYLSQLRCANVHLFYRLLADNIKVCLFFFGIAKESQSLLALTPTSHRPNSSQFMHDIVWRDSRLISPNLGPHPPNLHSDCRRGMPALVRDLHPTRGHVPLVF
jgi:hypothetical protein